MKVSIPNIVVAAFGVLLMFILLVAFAYGIAVQRYQLFPFKYLNQIEDAINWSMAQAQGKRSPYYEPTDRTETYFLDPAHPQPDGLNLITAMAPDNGLALKVVDMRGETVHEWAVDWFDIWPDATHLPPKAVPKTRPGTHLHGTLLLPDGDILFNFETQGTVRMGVCGDVRWRLPRQTHHSIDLDDDGVLWIPSMVWHDEQLPEYPTHVKPVMEETFVRVTLDGEVLEEVSMFDLLAANDQRALLLLRANTKVNTVAVDSLHMNDIETFPAGMAEGFFKRGDFVVSLRNINTIIVFDAERRIKLLKIGGFVRQHDPDFVDGNTLMLYDNNNIGPEQFGQQSRILLLDGPTGELTEVYTGTDENPFYSYRMGKQQLLGNGHLLITDSMSGRGFEIDPAGEIIWEYINFVDEGLVGYMEEVQRIPREFADVFAAADCGAR